MLLIGTEWTYIARRVMHQAMTHHFILALETLPTDAAWTAFYGTEMGPFLGMHVRMGAVSAVSSELKCVLTADNLLKEILGLERRRCAVRMRTFVVARHRSSIG